MFVGFFPYKLWPLSKDTSRMHLLSGLCQQCIYCTPTYDDQRRVERWQFMYKLSGSCSSLIPSVPQTERQCVTPALTDLSAHSQLPHAQLAQARQEMRPRQFEVVAYVTKSPSFLHHIHFYWFINLQFVESIWMILYNMASIKDRKTCTVRKLYWWIKWFGVWELSFNHFNLTSPKLFANQVIRLFSYSEDKSEGVTRELYWSCTLWLHFKNHFSKREHTCMWMCKQVK